MEGEQAPLKRLRPRRDGGGADAPGETQARRDGGEQAPLKRLRPEGMEGSRRP